MRRNFGIVVCSILFCGALPTMGQTYVDAVSREVTVYMDCQSATPTDAVSREVTVYSDCVNPVTIDDAASREFSLRYQSPCDTNCDGSVNQFDIQPFIAALISEAGCSPCAGDTNGNGTANQFDISGFIDCLTP